ncbi:L-aspartate oxidase [uncultured Williamsia sp.]|uniref:L-aspartate oxidase n=1 Tax=uncultured Williamsia sp. TaxID=259311 RepID=UPI00261FA8A9|nr:L-aspartate oxidase [uncultured Williamsia sp.]
MDVDDLVVVGAGVAGLTAALHAVERGLSVSVVAAADARDGSVPAATSTAYAQGGMAAFAPGRGDSLDAHVADTLTAAAGHADLAAVRSILADGPAAVDFVAGHGLAFDRDPSGDLARTREGGHAVRRIVHAGGDATGAHLHAALWSAVRHDPRIRVRRAVVRDVAMVDGRAVGVVDADGQFLPARSVVLATGGLGALWTSTTNPPSSVGSGVALALRAGATVADLEFVQFHPTMLFTPGAGGRCLLITEALRGEGARLVHADGASITAGVHPLGDLAPRDVVASAAHHAMVSTGAPCVFLDARDVPDLARRFPTVTTGVRATGIDPVRDLIPVVPGAHYHCGGVLTDLRARTDVPGLLAAGEVARTGLHGANRLASNSLTEAVVMGVRAVETASEDLSVTPPAAVPQVRHDRGPGTPAAVIRAAMTAGAGIDRDAVALENALAAIDSGGSADTADMALVARAVVTAALLRTESRGCHRRSDAVASGDADATFTLRLDGAGGELTASTMSRDHAPVAAV